jgi:hypothetical protein
MCISHRVLVATKVNGNPRTGQKLLEKGKPRARFEARRETGKTDPVLHTVESG